jgi:NTE family protein
MEGVTQWLKETLGDRLFQDLKIPCAVTAVDLNVGQEVVLSEGLVRDAVLATIALPGIFPTIEMDGWELVDGGVVNPVPVSVARLLAPGLPVVAVTLAQSLGVPTHKWKMPMPTLVPRVVVERVNRMNFAQSLDIYMRAVEVGSRALAEYRLKADHPEVVIRPAVGNIDLLETVDPRKVAKLGEEAMQAALPELRRAVSWQARFTRFVGGGN